MSSRPAVRIKYESTPPLSATPCLATLSTALPRPPLHPHWLHHYHQLSAIEATLAVSLRGVAVVTLVVILAVIRMATLVTTRVL